MIIVTYIVFHIICGLLAAGASFAYNQRRFPSLAKLDYAKDMSCAYLYGLVLGPFALITECIVNTILIEGFNPFKYGLKFY